MNFVKGILKVTGKIPMMNKEHLEGVNIEELMDSIIIALDNDLTGRIVDVESSNGDLVIIERFEKPGREHHVGEMTKRQMELYTIMGVDIPS